MSAAAATADAQAPAKPKSKKLLFIIIGVVVLALVGGGAAARSARFVHRERGRGTCSVSAVSPQMLGGITYAFASWSDGGAASHLVTFPNAGAATLTATYDSGRIFYDSFE